MGSYTVIADTSLFLVEMLRRELMPDVLQNPDQIGLRSPKEHEDVSVGVFLYDIRESDEFRRPPKPMIRNEKASRAPLYLSLYYMITAYSGGDVKYRLAQEEKILGKIMQAFYDSPILPFREAEGALDGAGLRIAMLSISMDDKSRICPFSDAGYHRSLFYKVSPVALESGISSEIARVSDLEVNVGAFVLPPAGGRGRGLL